MTGDTGIRGRGCGMYMYHQLWAGLQRLSMGEERVAPMLWGDLTFGVGGTNLGPFRVPVCTMSDTRAVATRA